MIGRWWNRRCEIKGHVWMGWCWWLVTIFRCRSFTQIEIKIKFKFQFYSFFNIRQQGFIVYYSNEYCTYVWQPYRTNENIKGVGRLWNGIKEHRVCSLCAWQIAKCACRRHFTIFFPFIGLLISLMGLCAYLVTIPVELSRICIITRLKWSIILRLRTIRSFIQNYFNSISSPALNDNVYERRSGHLECESVGGYLWLLLRR